MKITEVIAVLQTLFEKHGDLPVCFESHSHYITNTERLEYHDEWITQGYFKCTTPARIELIGTTSPTVIEDVEEGDPE